MSIQTASIEEYFRDRVEEVQKRRQLDLEEMTQFYVVNLLAQYLDARKLFPVENGEVTDEPLALTFLRAHEISSDPVRYQMLRSVGDRSLYVSGFFADSFRRKLFDIDYYISLGEKAYGQASALSRDLRGHQSLGHTFRELAQKFKRLVDVIGEISEDAKITSDQDLLRLYERWLHTRSSRLFEALKGQGIIPGAKDSGEPN